MEASFIGYNLDCHEYVLGGGQIQTGPPEAHVRGGVGEQGGGEQRGGHLVPGAQVQRGSAQEFCAGDDLTKCGAGDEDQRVEGTDIERQRIAY